jgi:hypothetical protein
LEQALRYLEEHGFEALIAVSDGMNSFLESNAVWVLGGARLMGEGALVLDCQGHSTLIVTLPGTLSALQRNRSPTKRQERAISRGNLQA